MSNAEHADSSATCPSCGAELTVRLAVDSPARGFAESAGVPACRFCSVSYQHCDARKYLGAPSCCQGCDHTAPIEREDSQ
jgi:hydrogenase maturation factor HypF (carbamoyltransferase family)